MTSEADAGERALCHAQVISDKGTGESKGYGFVKYYRMADAMNAIAYMNGYALGSKHLKVTFKTPVMRI
jgi:RNA recognition motif-containing protein